jgi:hypothetical protein
VSFLVAASSPALRAVHCMQLVDRLAAASRRVLAEKLLVPILSPSRIASFKYVHFLFIFLKQGKRLAIFID